jgi:hypothetical protein
VIDLVNSLHCNPLEIGKDIDPNVEYVLSGVVKTVLDSTDIKPSDDNIRSLYAAFFAMFSAGIRLAEYNKKDYINLMLQYRKEK